MAAPLSEKTALSIKQFLAANEIPSETHLELISNREGRSVVHLNQEGLDYTIKWFSPDRPALKDEFERENHFYILLKPLQTGKTPVLLRSDDSSQALLLSRIAGRGMRETEIDRRAVEQAAAFLLDINREHESDLARTSSKALGACFAINEHLTAVSELVTAIQQYLPSVNPQTRLFIDDELSPVWQKVLGNILTQFQTAAIDIEQPIAENSRILSPGEFGFHNAIVTPEREICFVDFDQSGWDDPARLICRFFTIGPIPPKEAHWDTIIDSLAQVPELDPQFAIRARLLLPAYQIARACTPILKCLQDDARAHEESEGAPHSKTKLITITNRSRQWLIKANQGL
ncbi:MAG: phosphotransferase [Verrucomicrobia bacterium]|jgi:hypothetical protein|nr:phosphotransferase [Pseudomonadota bacterium]MBT5706230.1 phosphotransferase [Verrucomicrobiota bacterium]MDB4746121.1 aminoglycoside phosphotransferase family protein [Verrucomicrobiota bacterium]